MRVRIRRFGRLTLIGKSGHSETVVVAGSESSVDQLGGTRPPAVVDRRGLCRNRVRQSEAAHLRIDFGAALPLLELQRTQLVPNPLVVFDEGLRRVRQLEVLLPSRQI